MELKTSYNVIWVYAIGFLVYNIRYEAQLYKH